MKQLDMVAPRTIEMVVLAVDVSSDYAADGDVTRAWSDRDEQPLRYERMEKTIDACARVGGDEDGVGVGVRFVNGESGDVGGFDDGPTSILRGIPVAAAEAASDEAAFE